MLSCFFVYTAGATFETEMLTLIIDFLPKVHCMRVKIFTIDGIKSLVWIVFVFVCD